MLSSHRHHSQSPITTTSNALSTSPASTALSRASTVTSDTIHRHDKQSHEYLKRGTIQQQQQQQQLQQQQQPQQQQQKITLETPSKISAASEKLDNHPPKQKAPNQASATTLPVPQRHTQPTTTRVMSSQSSTSPKIISENYFECSTGDIIVLVSSMLQELVNLNDALPFDASQLTRFHSRSPPSISLRDYLIRITKFCSLEKSILLAMIYYIDLLCTTYKIFNINSLTVHRFLITAAMVASKGLCDTFCTNTHYAKVGGLSKLELNSLEVEFLIRVDYRIVPEVERLSQYFERMVMRMKGKYVFAASQPAAGLNPPQQQQQHKSRPESSDAQIPLKVSLPSEVAHREGRKNCSSPLKRQSSFANHDTPGKYRHNSLSQQSQQEQQAQQQAVQSSQMKPHPQPPSQPSEFDASVQSIADESDDIISSSEEEPAA